MSGGGMLPHFIIEEIRKREEAKRDRRPQPMLELPIPSSFPPCAPKKDEAREERGTVVIEL